MDASQRASNIEKSVILIEEQAKNWMNNINDNNECKNTQENCCTIKDIEERIKDIYNKLPILKNDLDFKYCKCYPVLEKVVI